MNSTEYQDNNVVLLTIEMLRNEDFWTQIKENLLHIYNFALKGKLSVTAGTKKLLPDRPVRGYLKANQWSYFNLHHHTSDSLMINFESTMSACRLFVDKGVHSKINKEHHLVSSASLMEKGVEITRDMLPSSEDLSGAYTVAVRCYSDASYRIEYRSGESRIHQVRLNEPVSLSLLEGAEDYVEFFNYGDAADLQIYFRSSVANVSITVIQIDPQTIFQDHAQALENKPATLPTEDRYDFATERGTVGIGKLIIPQTAQKNCTLCRMIALVKVSQDDVVEFRVKKSTPSWPVELREDESLFNLLEPGQSDYYLVKTKRFYEAVQANLMLKSGLLTVEVSDTVFNGSGVTSMTHKVMNTYRNHLTVERNPQTSYAPARMYLNVTALNHSEYSIIHAENLFKQLMSPMTTYKGFLGGGFSRSYTLLTNPNEQVQITLKVTSLNDYSAQELSLLFENKVLTKNLMKVYVADSVLSSLTGNYSEVPAKIYYEQAENKFVVQLESSKPVVVIELTNRRASVLHFTIEATRNIRKDAVPQMVNLNFLSQLVPYQTYDIQVDHERAWITFDINECTEHIKASYVFMPNKRSSGQTKDPEIDIYTKYMNMRTVEVTNGPGILRLIFTISPESHEDSLSLGNKYTVERQSKVPIPAVYSFWYHVSPENSNDLGIMTKYQIHALNSDSNIEVQNINGHVKVKKIEIDNEEELLRDHNVRVAYTLIISTNSGLIKHLRTCGEFAIEEAAKFYKTSDYHVFTTYDYLTERSLKERKEYNEKYKYLAENNSGYVNIEPDFYSLGDTYSAVVVAKVLVYGKEVRLT